jgi:hypothetical protein
MSENKKTVREIAQTLHEISKKHPQLTHEFQRKIMIQTLVQEFPPPTITEEEYAMLLEAVELFGQGEAGTENRQNDFLK